MAVRRLRLFSECVADIAGHPSVEYDPERESERGGQRRCTRSGALDCGAVRHRRISQTHPHLMQRRHPASIKTSEKFAMESVNAMMYQAECWTPPWASGG